jgi:hypothetical protein
LAGVEVHHLDRRVHDARARDADLLPREAPQSRVAAFRGGAHSVGRGGDAVLRVLLQPLQRAREAEGRRVQVEAARLKGEERGAAACEQGAPRREGTRAERERVRQLTKQLCVELPVDKRARGGAAAHGDRPRTTAARGACQLPRSIHGGAVRVNLQQSPEEAKQGRRDAPLALERGGLLAEDREERLALVRSHLELPSAAAAATAIRLCGQWGGRITGSSGSRSGGGGCGGCGGATHRGSSSRTCRPVGGGAIGVCCTQLAYFLR